MRRGAAGLAVLLALAPREAPAQDARVGRMREYLAAAAGLGHMSGSILVAEQGRILVDTAYGWANRELRVRNTPDTRFRVASVTKQFTGMAVMLLAQDGALALTDPLSRYVDSLPPEWSGITIHHLLRHTSGISDYEGWFDGYATQAYSDYMSQAGAAERIVRDARRKPLDFAPGTAFHYSNSAYVFLGYVIARASGMSYEAFVRSRILEPLGMSRSGQDHSSELLPDRAAGYRLRPGAYPRAYFAGLTDGDYLNAFYQLMEPPQADAGLVTTSRDLYKWDQALYTDRLLPAALRDSLFARGMGNYGYGWFVRDGPDGVTHEHSGGLPGFTCYILRMPERRRTIILLGNQDRLGRTLRDLAAILRGEPVATPQPRRLLPQDSAAGGHLAGTYRTESGDSVEVSATTDGLVIYWREHFRSPLFPESVQQYFVPVPNATARFRERNGALELVVHSALGELLVRGVRR